MITTVCKISYGSQTVPPIVPAVQGDTGRAISFEIADFTPPAGATATYFILKPSGEAIYNSATITDNSILCELTAQSLAEAGENRMQVRVLQGENIVTSFEVILMVRTFLGDDAIESGTEMNIFDQAVEQATEEFQTNAEQIVEEVIESIPADYTELTEEVDELNERINNLDPGLSDDAKTALLNCFAHVAWVDDHGQDYYDALEEALYADQYPMITVVYAPGTHVVYTDDTLDSLKPYLTVTYYETSESTGSTISSDDYSLLGTLSEGSNTISVLYQNLHASVSVNNVVDFYNIYEWSMSNGLLISHVGTVNTNAEHGMVISEGATDRRTVGTSHGVYPYWGTITAGLLDIYPIPIPMNAKKCTITITPSKSLISRGYRIFNGEKYGSAISWVTYTQGPLVIDLPDMSEQYYLQLSTQYESGSSTYPEEIEEFTISFSDEA